MKKARHDTAKVINGDSVMVAVDALRPHPANPRMGDVGAIHESIVENGFYGTIVVQKSTGYILAGNHRMKAAKEAGLDAVPVVYVDVDDERAMRILLADNRTNDLASYDNDALAQLLDHLASTEAGLSGTGYDGDALDDLLKDLGKLGGGTEDPEAKIDVAEELREQWGVEKGDLWEIPSKDGKRTHRLLCGDSTNADDVMRLLDGNHVDLCLTDPPYGIGDTVSDKNNYRTYVDTKDNLDTLIAEFLPLAMKMCDRVVVTPGNMHQRRYPAPTWVMAWFTPAGIGRGPWGFMCWQPVLCFGGDPKLAKGQGSHPDALVHTEKASNDIHPCAKPIKFWQWLLLRTSVDRGSVYDPFAGSGTTLVAAENESRACFAMEIDPAYVAVCLERMKAMGLEPVRVATETLAYA